MPKKKYIVSLTVSERKFLEQLTKKGKIAAYKMNHARIIQLLEDRIVELKNENEQIKTELLEYIADNQEAIEGMQASIDTLEEALTQAQDVIEVHRRHIGILYQEIEAQKAVIDDLNQTIDAVKVELDGLRDEFSRLRLDLDDLSSDTENNFKLLDTRVSTLEGKVIVAQKLVERNNGSGGGGAAIGAQVGAQTQTNFLKLLSQLTRLYVIKTLDWLKYKIMLLRLGELQEQIRL
jgi:chromosome segregation ATPase